MFEFKKAEIGIIEEDQPAPSHLPFAIKKATFDPKQPPISLADGEDLWVGIDAEWVTRDGQNIVLSYQDYCVNSRDETLGKVIYPEPGKRLAFETLISMAVEDCRAAGLIKKWPRKIVVG